LSHLGLAADLDLPAEGAALVIGGHSHTLLSGTEPGAAGPSPTLARGGAAIVQAGCYGRYLGRVDLDVAADGTVLALAAACRHVGLDLAPDPEVAAIVARYAAPLADLRNRPVATLEQPLETANCRLSPCRLGELVAGALRHATHGHAIGLMNAGGLRVGLPAGPVTLGQVLDTMPFGNTLATATLTGADLADTVRHGLAMFGRGGFAQWSGLRLDGVSIAVEAEDGAWVPLDPGAQYLIATNNFVRNGGDGYTLLRDRAQASYDTGPGLADLLAEALERFH
jgi:5'-nucleotidase